MSTYREDLHLGRKVPMVEIDDIAPGTLDGMELLLNISIRMGDRGELIAYYNKKGPIKDIRSDWRGNCYLTYEAHVVKK